MQSWHPDYRPAELQLDEDITWLKLDILGCLTEGDKAMVEFEAQLLLDGKVQGLREKSQFVVDQGRWLYTSGEMMEPNFKSCKPGRNEECPCGSGVKFKRCCGA